MNTQARTSRFHRGARLAGLAIGAGLMLFASSAMAHGRVDWSIGIGVGGPAVVYQQPEVVYAQPEVVYEQPEVVYEQPRVVYERPRVVYERAPVVEYRESYGWRREHAWREHEWREHHRGRDWDDRGHGGWRRD